MEIVGLFGGPIAILLCLLFMFWSLWRQEKANLESSQPVFSLEDSFKEKDKARKEASKLWSDSFLMLEASSHNLSVEDFREKKKLEKDRHRLIGKLNDTELYGIDKHSFVSIDSCTCKGCMISHYKYKIEIVEKKLERFNRA